MTGNPIEGIEGAIARFTISPHRCAEIGVYKGNTAAAMLKQWPIIESYHMVDQWCSVSLSTDYFLTGDPVAKHSDDEWRSIYAQAARAVEPWIVCGVAHIHKADQEEASKQIEDASLDLVFIDADHSYKGVMTCLKTWWPKIRHGGIILGHDYDGKGAHLREVKPAWDDFLQPRGLKADVFRNTVCGARVP